MEPWQIALIALAFGAINLACYWIGIEDSEGLQRRVQD